MIIDKLPPIPVTLSSKGTVQRMKEHVLAILLLGTVDTAKEIRKELLEVLAVIDNALERNRTR